MQRRHLTIPFVLASLIPFAPGPAPLQPTYSFAVGSTGVEQRPALTTIPDITGDGMDELVVGIAQRDLVEIWNPRTKMLVQSIQLVLPPGTTFEFGYDVAALQYDGAPGLEIAVGAPNAQTTGRVYVYSVTASSTALLTTINPTGLFTNPPPPASPWRFGQSLTSIDPNGDGLDELAIGAPQFTPTTGTNQEGMVQVFDPRNGAFLSVVVGTVSGEQLGHAVTRQGMDGDGIDDLIVGAPGAGGRVDVYGGASLTGTPVLLGSTPGGPGTLGAAVAPAGTTPGGAGRFLAGAPRVTATTGAAEVHTLAGGGTAMVFAYADPPAAAQNRGSAVASVADRNNDSIPDLAVAADWFGGGMGTSGAGNVRILSGLDGTLIHTLGVNGKLIGYDVVRITGPAGSLVAVSERAATPMIHIYK